MTHEAQVGTFEPQIQEERISNEELGNLLAAIGNGEQKAMLLSVMALHPYTIFTGNDMRQHIADAQGLPFNTKVSDGWVESNTSLENHCSSSFSMIGLVSEELKDRENNVYGYMVTRKGLVEGQVLAGLLLDYSERHDVALRAIFSDTSSQGNERKVGVGDQQFDFKNRAPLNRMKILKALLSLPMPAKAVDVSYQMIGLDRDTVGEHCRDLGENGIITFKPGPKEGSRVEYRLKNIPEVVDLHPKFKKLTGDVCRILESEADRNWTTDSLIEKLVQEDESRQSQTALRNSLGKVLGKLRNDGVIDVLQAQGGISLTHEQRSNIGELIDILEKFQSRDAETFTRGRQLAFEFATQPQKALSALARAKQFSSHAEALTQGVVNKVIISAISENPGSTADDVRDYLQRIYNYKLKPPTIRNYLARLRSEGIIESTGKVGSVMHWNIKED